MIETPPRAARSVKVIAAAVIVGLIGSGMLVWQASSAAFSATTENPDNAWATGKVLLSDNDSDVAMFTATDLGGGDTGSNCIEVEYDGNVASTVKLYSDDPTGTLGDYLDLNVELGDGVSCAVPGTYTRIFGDVNTVPDAVPVDTLADFGVAHTDFSNGIAGWTPSAVNTVRPYRFTYTVFDDNVAQDQTAGLKFIWEAQNT